MNKIARKIELLNETTLEEGFFDHNKVFVSNAMFAGTYPEFIKKKNKKKIVFSGNFLEQKGIKILAQIIENRINNEYEFHVYGGFLETTDDSVKIILKKLQSMDNVYFFGHVNDMSEAYADASVVLSLQAISNYPSQVVLEALANGCAVVIRDVGDSRRFGSGHGIYYVSELSDADDYWKAIFIASTFSELNATNISKFAREKFNPKSYVEQFISQLS